MKGLQLPSEDDIRKYMLENITEEQFKAMMEEEMNINDSYKNRRDGNTICCTDYSE